jgi:orotidine-5'-phosphate decarboxylase
MSRDMEPRERVIIALDLPSAGEAMRMVDLLEKEVDIFKVGIAPFVAYGERILTFLREKGKKVFLDLKYHDIPNTVRNACAAAVNKDIFMLNFHCMGGEEMMKAAAEARKDAGSPLLLGVTVLTSMGEEALRQIGISGRLEEMVLRYASAASEAGLDGVVASPREVRMIKEKAGKDLIVVTPGVRPVWAAAQDQKRITTPAQAIKEGADYLVIGRPVIRAEEPLDAIKRIYEEIGS